MSGADLDTEGGGRQIGGRGWRGMIKLSAEGGGDGRTENKGWRGRRYMG